MNQQQQQNQHFPLLNMLSQTGNNNKFDLVGEIKLYSLKNKFQESRYFCLKKNIMVIYKSQEDQQSFKQIILQQCWTVKWIFNKKIESKKFEDRAIGFKLLTINEDLTFEDFQYEEICRYYGDSNELVVLRQYFQKNIFEFDFYYEFILLNKIGKGKYSKVYKVQEKSTEKFFAMKYLNKKKLESLQFGQQALLQELCILRIVNHPNLLKFVRAFQDKEAYYIVTELLNNEKTLQDELQKYNQSSVFCYDIIKKIMKQLLSGIDYLHSKGFMHRDLKPQNIIFADQNKLTINNLKIIDFGLAQNLKDKDFLYTHVGTPGFVAPEILINDQKNINYNEKCDIFSLGVIFHQLLTGKPVFPGKKFEDVLILNQKCQIIFQGEKYYQISQNALNLMQLMLNNNPEERLSAKESLLHPFFQDDDNTSLIPNRRQSYHQIDYLIVNKKNEVNIQNQHNSMILSNHSNKLSHLYINKAISILKQPKQNHNNCQLQKNMLYRVLRQLITVIIEFQYEKNNQFRNYIDDTSPNRQPVDFNFLQNEIQEYSKQNNNDQNKIENNIRNNANSLSTNSSLKFKNQDNLELQNNVEVISQQNSSNQSHSSQNSNQSQDIQFKDNKQKFHDINQLTEEYKQNQIKQLQEQLEKELKINEDYNQQKNVKQKGQQKFLKLQITHQTDNNIDEVIEHQVNNQKNQQTNQNNNQQLIINQQQQQKIPKDFILLINYFPQDIILPFLLPNFTLQDIIKQINLLGLFLLFGKKYKQNYNQEQILERLNIKKQKKFDSWYIVLMEKMVFQNIGLVEIQSIINKNVKNNN